MNDEDLLEDEDDYLPKTVKETVWQVPRTSLLSR